MVMAVAQERLVEVEGMRGSSLIVGRWVRRRRSVRLTLIRCC